MYRIVTKRILKGTLKSFNFLTSTDQDTRRLFTVMIRYKTGGTPVQKAYFTLKAKQK